MTAEYDASDSHLAGLMLCYDAIGAPPFAEPDSVARAIREAREKARTLAVEVEDLRRANALLRRQLREADADASFAPALAAHNRVAGDSIQQRREEQA